MLAIVSIALDISDGELEEGVTPNSVHLDTKVLHPSWKDALRLSILDLSQEILVYDISPFDLYLKYIFWLSEDRTLSPYT